MNESIFTIVASIAVSASIAGAGAAYYVSATIDRKLSRFENDFLKRLGDHYVSGKDLDRLEAIQAERYGFVRDQLMAMQASLNDLRKHHEA